MLGGKLLPALIFAENEVMGCQRINHLAAEAQWRSIVYKMVADANVRIQQPHFHARWCAAAAHD